MGRRSQASTNPTLTNYAVGVSQDLRSTLADFIAPPTRVPSATAQYKRYDEKNAFQVYDTARPIGGSATRIEFKADDPSCNCKPQALEITVDDAEREAAGDADPLGLDQAKIKTLVSTSTLSHEAKVLQKTIDATTPENGLGVWSNPDVDPIKELDQLIIDITTSCGMMPNRLAIGLGAWAVLREHAKVLARQPGAALIGLTVQQLAAMLINPGIEIRVGVLSRDTAKFGKGAAKQQLLSAKAAVFIGSNNPTQYDPSWAKCFMTGSGNIAGVRTYREEPFTDVHLVDWTEDIQVTSSIAGKVIAVA